MNRKKEKAPVWIHLVRVGFLITLLFVLVLPASLAWFTDDKAVANNFNINFGTVSVGIDKKEGNSDYLVADFGSRTTIYPNDMYNYSFNLKNQKVVDGKTYFSNVDILAVYNYKISIMYGEGDEAEDITNLLTNGPTKYVELNEVVSPTEDDYFDAENKVLEFKKGEGTPPVEIAGTIHILGALPNEIISNGKTYYFNQKAREIEGTIYTSEMYPKIYLALKIGISAIQKDNNVEIDEITGEEQLTASALTHFTNQREGARNSISEILNTSKITLSNPATYTIKNMKIYGNSTQNNLPSEYKQVEYIESSGAQYIDTNIAVNQSVGFDIKFITYNNLAASTYGSVLGGRTNSSVNEVQLTTYSHSGNNGILRFGTKSYNAGLEKDKIMQVSLKNAEYLNNDGQKQALTNTAFEAGCNLTIFALNNAGNITQFGKVRLYYLDIYLYDTIVRSYIPCYRISDNVVGLFDLIEGKFYTNNGSGSFVKGVDVPTTEVPVEVESFGEKTVNLFDFSKAINTGSTTDQINKGNNYIIVKKNNKTTEANPGTSAWSSGWCSFDFNFKAGNTYTISYNIEYLEKMSEFNFPVEHRILLNNGGTYSKAFNIDGLNKKFSCSATFTPTIDCSDFTFSVNSCKVKISNIQIQNGSIATEYEPYGKYKIEIAQSSKNLFDVNGGFQSNASGSPTVIEDNNIKLPYTSGNSISSVMKQFIKVEENETYNCSFKLVQGKARILIKFYGNNSEDYLLDDSSLTPTGFTYNMYYKGFYKDFTTTNIAQVIQIPTGVKYIKFCFCAMNYAAGQYSIYSDFQFEEGSASTFYVPYINKTTKIYLDEPLRKVGDYADYIDLKTGQVVRNIKTYTVKGTEGLTLAQSSEMYNSDYSTNRIICLGSSVLNDLLNSSGSDQLALVNCLSFNQKVWSKVSEIGFTTNAGYQFHLRFANDWLNIESTDDYSVRTTKFAEFLKGLYNGGTPVVIHYVTCNPITETIDVSNLSTHEYANILTINSGDVAASKVEIEYYTDAPI